MIRKFFKGFRVLVVFSTMSAMAVSPLVNTITPYLSQGLAERIEVKPAHAITCDAAGFTDIGGGVCRGVAGWTNSRIPGT